MHNHRRRLGDIWEEGEGETDEGITKSKNKSWNTEFYSKPTIIVERNKMANGLGLPLCDPYILLCDYCKLKKPRKELKLQLGNQSYPMQKTSFKISKSNTDISNISLCEKNDDFLKVT